VLTAAGRRPAVPEPAAATPTAATSPALGRIQLGAELRRLREAAGKTIDQVSRDLSAQLGPGFSPTKLSRLETGKRPANQRDVRDLCLYYEATAEELDHLVELAKASRSQNRWQGLTEAYAEYIALESIADGVRTYESALVPGLLQTPEYSQAVAIGDAFEHTATEGEGADMDIKIRVRVGRQRRLRERPPLRFHAIMDENVLRRAIGGPVVMSGQLRHMYEISRLRNVTLQVVPITRGAYPGIESAGFSILDFAAGVHTQDYVCFLEGIVGAVWAERETERLRIVRVFQYMTGLALSPLESRDLIEAVARGLGED
jgi:transcriptional regulator with XRE-family HTH domain